MSKSKCTKHTRFGPLLEVEMSKKCAPLWREAHFEVNMDKTHQVRTTFGSWDVEKVHAVVARGTFRSKSVQNTPTLEHFWKLTCRKSASRCGAKHISKSKCQKHHMFAPLLDIQMSFCVAGARDCTPRQKWAKREGFVAVSKSVGRRGTFEEDLHRRISPGRRSTRDMSIRYVKRLGRWFPERGCILEHQIVRCGKMILCDRCSTSYDLASLFPGRRNTLETWTGKIAKHIGTSWIFHYWRKSRGIASFLMLSIVVNFENSRLLAELLRFWHCQVQILKTSRRIAAFLMLSSSETEEVSQNSFVFKLADRQIDR